MNPPPHTRRQPLVPDLPDHTAVKLIGLGGVGGVAARYGAMFLASLGRTVRLVLIDGDAFEPSNATRMYFAGAGNKAEVVRAELRERFADTPLTLVAVPEFVTPANIARLIHPGDIILLAVDNHATRKLVNDHCAGLARVCLISGGNDGVGPDNTGRVLRGTFGNCQVYIRRDGADASPSLTRFHPEIRDPADQLPTDLSCTELLASVPQILFTNLQTAAAMLNALFLYLCGCLHYSELSFDIADGVMRPAALPAPVWPATESPPVRVGG